MKFKFLKVPAGDQNITAIKTWEVRWTSRHGSYSSDVTPEVEVFADYASADTFRQAISNAIALLKNSGDETQVKLCERS